MLSSAQIVFNMPELIIEIFSHFDCDGDYDDDEHGSEGVPLHYAQLVSLSLLTRAWTHPSRERLHRTLVFNKGPRQLAQWLEATRGRSYVTLRVSIEQCEYEDGDEWDCSMIAEVLKRLRDVESLEIMIDLREKALPHECFLNENMSRLSRLCLASPISSSDPSQIPPFRLASLTLCDHSASNPITRDWRPTCALLTRRSAGIGHPSLFHLELRGFSSGSWCRILAPPFPLHKPPPPPPSSIGSLFPFSRCLRVLALPSLDTVASINPLENLALFGLGCTSLDTLYIDTMTPYSTASVGLLKFFPTIRQLCISHFTALPLANDLHPIQIERFLLQGQGDILLVLTEFIKVHASTERGGGPLPHLEHLVLQNTKFVEERDFDKTRMWLKELGDSKIRFQIGNPYGIPWSQQDHDVYRQLRHEIIFLNRRQGIAQQTASASRVPQLDSYEPGGALFASLDDGDRVEDIQ
ncbi:hypothetical protein JCM11491_003570 [Sporobolomyces phaffii]